MSPPRFARLWALAAFVLLLVSNPALAAFTPPPLRGHVVDQAGALSDVEVRRLDKKLDLARQQTGFAIVVYLLPQLPDGMSIEDVGYQAGNTWGVGSKDGDDGILLLAALAEHKLRIETGKGAGGALTDIESSHINREVIGPLMKEGRTYEAMNRGVDAILKAVVANEPGGSAAGRKPPPHAPPKAADYVKTAIGAAVILGVIVLAIVSPTFRSFLFFFALFGRFGGGGGRGRDDDDDGGSGYGGGGGSFGGGGSSDDY